MPWGDKAVSPCVFTPGVADADKMSLSAGLSLTDGRIRLEDYLFYRLKILAAAGTNWVTFNKLKLKDSSGIFHPVNFSGYTKDGFTVSASDEYDASTVAWKLFTSVASDRWSAISAGGFPHWIQMSCPTHKKVESYVINIVTYPSYAPTSWILQGSLTGLFAGEEENIHSVTAYSWGSNTEVEFTP